MNIYGSGLREGLGGRCVEEGNRLDVHIIWYIDSPGIVRRRTAVLYQTRKSDPRVLRIARQMVAVESHDLGDELAMHCHPPCPTGAFSPPGRTRTPGPLVSACVCAYAKMCVLVPCRPASRGVSPIQASLTGDSGLTGQRACAYFATAFALSVA